MAHRKSTIRDVARVTSAAQQRRRDRATAQPQAAGSAPEAHQASSPPAPQRRRGRPPIYSEDIAGEILDRLACGEALIAICRDPHMPSDSTVRDWIIDDINGFAGKYTRARDAGLDRMAEELIEIADDNALDIKVSDDGKSYVDHDHINRSRLRVDARKWLLCKLAPKRYGDKLQVDQTITEVARMDDAELGARLRELAAKLGLVTTTVGSSLVGDAGAAAGEERS